MSKSINESSEKEKEENIAWLEKDVDLLGMLRIWQRQTANYKYTYNFSWLGRPIIQFPQDMVAMQEIPGKFSPTWLSKQG